MKHKISARYYIDQLSANGQIHFTAKQMRKDLRATAAAVESAIRRLKQNHEIVGLTKGFYLILPPAERVLNCLPPNQFIPVLMRHWRCDYYVCLLSAAMYHGAVHQQPQAFQVMLAKNKRDIHCGKVRVQFAVKRNLKKTPTQRVKTISGFLNISTPEATAIDLICYMRKSGGINHIATVINELAEVIQPGLLLLLAKKSKELYLFQKLGFLLDYLGYSRLSEPLYAYLKTKSTNIVPLSHLKTKGAKRDLKWRVIINTQYDYKIRAITPQICRSKFEQGTKQP